jgi:hypothetical protein
MNKYFSKSFLASLALVMMLLSSCKKNNVVVDQDPLNVPTYAKFNTRLLTDSSATYYIKSTNDPFKLPIGVSTVSNVDRTIHFSYTSTSAVAGVQYNAPSSITIPAGKTIDTLNFTGLFSGYPLSSRKDTVIITITDDGDIPGSHYITPKKDVYRLVLRKYCDVVLNDLLGDYANSTDQQGTGTPTSAYTASIVSAVTTGPTTGTIVVYNFGDPMFGAPYNPGDLAITPGITLYLDWTDPANFKVTLPPAGQAIAVGYYGPNGLIKPPVSGGAIGTFSSCDQIFTVKYSFAIGSTSYGNFTTVLRR